jgi:hypothetical protein
MEPLTDAELRASFVNCSKGEAQRIKPPPGLAGPPWPSLDFLGWRDRQMPQRAYIVVPWEGRPVGFVLRSPTNRAKGLIKGSMCSICLTMHSASGVSVFVAPKAGQPGRDGNTVGSYICADLQCSLYVRGLLTSEAAHTMDETLSVEAKIDRLRARLGRFTRDVIGAQSLEAL